ncbi:MAG: FAD-dependent oxidoreductase [Rhodospirillales bacterium]|jgi:pyruvate/2-oxoglutarate dehydrogenase complex dihydrolipoamide dehydrogenase (E3) component|nr:FAD-dependent oxidoreductase [Rhodospirillales bacterium]
MSEQIRTDLCVIGAGSGGLSVAAAAAQMGARVVLVEKGRMGGDCLNYGCVPSKALIAAGRAAETMRSTGRYGIAEADPQITFAAIHDHVHGVIAGIAPHDSEQRFEGLGVRVIRAAGRFIGQAEVEAGDVIVHARRFVIATGSSPAVPPIDGLAAASYLTNETIFELRDAPDHLIVIGGGPIGTEMAQAHRRLGVRVTQIVRGRLLTKDDGELVEVVRRRLLAEGVALAEDATISEVEGHGAGVRVVFERGGGRSSVAGSHLLVAAGRSANVDGLGLDVAGVAFSERGITVDARLRTTNRRIFAVGDVTGRQQFTHVAGYHAGIVIRNALFLLPAKVDDTAVPWVTYTDPELAQVGLTEAAARDRFGAAVTALRWPFAENDRARTERDSDGLIKVVLGRRGRILGASIVGAGAGDQLALWCLAVAHRMKIGAVAGLILPYPTRAEAGKRAAGEYYAPALFSERTRALVRLLQRLP